MRKLMLALLLCLIVLSLAGQEAPVQHGPVFETASIHLDNGPFQPPSFALSSDAWFRDPLGRFHADFALDVYITFAYKLWLSPQEQKAVFAGLPDWVTRQRWSIEATAPLHATKDDYRQMMQTLLRERFHLELHFDQREMPVLLMTLHKAGQPGSRLIPHDRGPSCDVQSANAFPRECYAVAAMPKGELMLAGSRANSMPMVGRFLSSLGGNMGIDRPVIDHTGLPGLWDFSVECVSTFGKKEADPAADGETLLEAVRDQLGLDLKPGRATLPFLVVDHVERPSEN